MLEKVVENVSVFSKSTIKEGVASASVSHMLKTLTMKFVQRSGWSALSNINVGMFVRRFHLTPDRRLRSRFPGEQRQREVASFSAAHIPECRGRHPLHGGLGDQAPQPGLGDADLAMLQSVSHSRGIRDSQAGYRELESVEVRNYMCRYFHYSDSNHEKIIFFGEDNQAYEMQEDEDGIMVIEKTEAKLPEVESNSFLSTRLEGNIKIQ